MRWPVRSTSPASESYESTNQQNLKVSPGVVYVSLSKVGFCSHSVAWSDQPGASETILRSHRGAKLS